jgi:hypothetical protein
VVSVNKDPDGNRVITVTYNDGTPPALCMPNCIELPKVHFTSGPGGTRFVQKGASQLGWSYSTDDGQTWTNRRVLTPPSGQAVLWGDPAIATCPQPGCTDVFIANLAISEASFDAHAFDHPTYGPSLVGGLTAIDGACIARSTDGGKNFSIQQCVTNNGHFYDGGSIAMGSADGPIYAAWWDTDTALINVWRSPSPGQPFVRIASPPLNANMHPRIRADGEALYVAAQESSTDRVFMSRWNGTSWGAAKLFATVAYRPDIDFSNHGVRTGPQFSFDVAYGSAASGSASCVSTSDCVAELCTGGGTCLARCVSGQCKWEDQIRMAYTYKNSSNYYNIGVVASGRDLANVRNVPEWGVGWGAGDRYNPVMTAFRGAAFIAGPEWHMAYQTRAANPSGNTVALEHSRIYFFPNNFPFALHQGATAYQSVCPDLRSGQAGYWGDYNDIAWLGFNSSGRARWIATYTDSFDGCPTQYNFFSKHVHVGAAVFMD